MSTKWIKIEFIYKPKILKSGCIYKPDFRLLENEGSEIGLTMTGDLSNRVGII
jgi:hypothetical protein